MYIVMCRGDSVPSAGEWIPGKFEQATRQTFEEYSAALRYAEGIAETRDPLVIEIPTGMRAAHVYQVFPGDTEQLNKRTQRVSESRK